VELFAISHNAMSLAADADVLPCFEQARGQYVRIVDDEDVLAANAINLVQACLDNQE
jgi:hypothetical protein